jgi:penicillin-binding protein 1A
MPLFTLKKKPKRKAKKKPSTTSKKRGDGPKLTREPAAEKPREKGVNPSAHRPSYRNQMYARRGVRRGWIRGQNAEGERTWFGRTRKQLVLMFLSLSMTGLIILAAASLYIVQTLPDISSIGVIKKQRGITFETEDGSILASYGDIYGTPLTYAQIPKPLIQAVTATEDRRFFAHSGIDFQGILRAALVNLWAGRVVEGGSTITQQLAKNVFLTPKRSLMRKAQEAMLALWLESRYSKQEILSIYLNRVYLGAGTYGVDAAARRYFGKPATELSLMESAIIAGLLKAPSRFAPTASFERAKNRGYQVLLNMVNAGMLDAATAEATVKNYAAPEALQVSQGSDVRYFTDWVVDQLPNYIGRIEEDVVVTTTLNAQLQHQAQDALQHALAAEGEAKKASQGALVAMAPDGAVRALLGGVNYQKSAFNRATQARRQPGSVFKLFVYLAALEAGMTPESQVLDAPITLRVGNKNWSPDNYSKNYKGEISMARALRESLNTVSVRLSQYAGLSRVAHMAERLGISGIPAQPSIALGSVETTLLRLTSAYAHLPSYGYSVQPFGILKIRTQNGQEIYTREFPEQSPVLATSTVEMMNYMLLDTVRRGTAVKAALPGRDAAGKTGTSQNFTDAWFIGFTPQLIAGVWVGNDNNAPMDHVTGGSIPATIWHDFMISAMDGLPEEPIPNTPSASEGLLPWLFGGEAASEPEAAPENMQDVKSPATTEALPADLPFQMQLPADSAGGDNATR